MTGKRSKCPLIEEWIKGMWYICTMECYSATEGNSSESVMMRWTNLEPILQSEKKSQKEKDSVFNAYIWNLEGW